MDTNMWGAIISALVRKSAGYVLTVCITLVALISYSAEGSYAQTRTGTPSTAQVGGEYTEEQKKTLGKFIREYLMTNPEVMIDMQKALNEKQERERTAKLTAISAKIAKEPDNSSIGDPNGDLTIIEFFDYNCAPCRQGLSSVQRLVQEDRKLRFVFKELPILSKGSEEASKVALAARRQGKYWEFYQAMLGNKGEAGESSALRVAESLGLDMDRLKTDMESDEVKSELEKSKELADEIGIFGTPHFLVGHKSITGTENLHDRLRTLIAHFREKGCVDC